MLPDFDASVTTISYEPTAASCELSTKHREVLSRRLGLLEHAVGALDGVGREIGLNRERVRQIQFERLARLREGIESQSLSSVNVLS